MKALPNILTSLRLVLTLFVFLALATAAGAVPYVSERLTPEAQFSLQRWAFWSFVIAAVTDFFDGWLARKLDAVTVWGAILDPIGDKVLVCGAILGLLAMGGQPAVVLPAGLMLFREFTVSALREVGAGKGVKLPVTMLAKWKTTLQLTALAAELLVASWGAFGLPADPAIEQPVVLFAHGLMWLATIVTLITGAQYWEQTRKALMTK
ncbi:CDP-diacylglycerol--glycerol-3-phosphate 3-phosphatidyltransferase [Phenylobacterium sp. Root77]|jgi:CDP-diacylglycerol--glycerol-3-phosphate 3-phosphatidyltransferase|uniref:CDP-diacylglycerol--glycerol-3-phosphate 3-phosphatidyltransferase n=1 Tax=unclassified Phenylobacterium TaxID=2640670 RepID=UPI0006FB9D4B|nr:MULTISPECIES: CDP-diacylglycerol--glycerol-3-phosphate 3-phosphatidyltransferase [unclassified Phenylobacterium]KQW72969.1 CDP-diacylglycerol--glycerol-3-phosphate 3-phosphatidyltransferase [Phenylobacterium sp. Root1277]KQW92188.1 CDP-diacylglycerol--glycerol-3-phosphate 3-phosphatidyltransferase [Phenylobacterium sp. Root1290]KRC40419.1 CDP-diacylglycerol--glycerol-3-phosphate 3-phosphatidyltransferase [Phenylobacterium sp. Root77]